MENALVKNEQPSGGLPAVPQANSLLQALTAAASNPETDIGKMERLFAMHQQMVAQQAEVAFNEALARAQSHIVPVVKKKENSHTRSKYADLGDVIRMITPIATAEGLSISFDSKALTEPAGWIRTVAIVSHSLGHKREYTLDLPADKAGAKGNDNKTEVQAIVSSGSYAQRVIQCRIFNIPLVDNDGNAEGASGLTEDQLAEFDKSITGAKNAAALEVVWKAIVAACNKAKDKDAYKDLKGKVWVRKAEFGGAK